jgi:hypothetical protein
LPNFGGDFLLNQIPGNMVTSILVAKKNANPF